jgi:hypothetical protein
MESEEATYSASVYLIVNDDGLFLHRFRKSSYVWREDIRPYTVMQFKYIGSAVRAISRINTGGKPIKATMSFKTVPVPDCIGQPDIGLITVL